MGEIADMMLDGTLCEGCGSYIDDEGPAGFPRYCCEQCARDRGAVEVRREPSGGRNDLRNTNCPVCLKRVRRAGLADHMRVKHRAALGEGDAP